MWDDDDKIDEGEFALRSLIVIVCLILLAGCIVSIVKEMQG